MTKEAEADKRVIASIENKAQQQQWRTGMVTGPKPPPPGNGGNDLLTGEDKPLTFRREGAYYRGSNGKRYIVVGGPAPIP